MKFVGLHHPYEQIKKEVLKGIIGPLETFVFAQLLMISTRSFSIRTIKQPDIFLNYMWHSWNILAFRVNEIPSVVINLWPDWTLEARTANETKSYPCISFCCWWGSHFHTGTGSHPGSCNSLGRIRLKIQDPCTHRCLSSHHIIQEHLSAASSVASNSSNACVKHFTSQMMYQNLPSSQRGPFHPALHTHVKEAWPSTQWSVPSLSHGDGVHWSLISAT